MSLICGAGWYEYKTGAGGDASASTHQKAKAAEVQKSAELQWLKARLEARLRLMEDSTGHDSRALVMTT